jgi:tetratricopeptide (TPR) repeat protein
LKVHALEYALDIAPQKLKDQNRKVTERIKILDDPAIPLNKKEIEDYIKNTYQEIIIDIFKKIRFNLVVDSIDKLPPLLPEDTDYEFFGSIIGIMYSMLNSLNYLGAKINQSFEAEHKFHEDYLLYRCFDLVTHINLEFKDLTELLINEVHDDIYRINFHDCLNLINQLDNFYKQLRKIQDQKAKGSRITDLKECLENVSNIEEGLLNLFRSIVLVGLEHKNENKTLHSNIVYDPSNLSEDDNALDSEIDTRRFYKKINIIGKYANLVEPPELLSIITELTARIVKEYVEYIEDFFNKRKNIHSNIVYNLMKERNALNNEIDTTGVYKEIEILEKDLMENTNLEEPRELLPKITNLNAEIVKEYVSYSMNDYYPDRDIHSCYERMYRTLVIVRNDISGNLEKDLEKFERYPYLYPEIAELCNFWKFRLDALERKQGRKFLARINHYFVNHMYKKVSDASNMKGEKNNIKLLNIKYLNKIGVAKMQLGEYREAINNFNNILDMDRNNTDALFNLGLSYQEVEGKDSDGKFTRSIQQFEKILEKEPNHVNSLTSLGILFYRIGKYEDALKMITKAIRVSEQDDWRKLLAMGCILSDGKREYDNAKTYFDRCAELNPTSTLVKMNQSQNMILVKSYHEAEILLKDILDEFENIKDRSTKIITIIMLICLRYLNKDKFNPDNDKRIESLLRYLDLKETNLVIWNFRNLQITVNDSQELDNGDRQFLSDLLSIPGHKPGYESKSLKKRIQDFLINNNPSKNLRIIDYGEKIIDVDIIDRRRKSEWDETEWVVWKISLDQSSEFLKDGKVKKVVYQFDSTFQNNRIEISSTDDNNEFSINVMGWEKRKFDIELHRNDNTILKMVGDLKEIAQ